MRTGLLAYEPAIRLAAFAGVFVVMSAWEWIVPRRNQSVGRTWRWPNNLGVVVVDNPGTTYSHAALAMLARSDAVLVVCGILLLIGAHWEEIPRGVKIATGVVLMLGTHAAGWRLREGNGSYRKTGEALHLAGSCLFLANIALIGQLHLARHDASAVKRVPHERLGRVSSIDYLGSSLLEPVGLALGGWATERFGPALVFVVGGALQAAILMLGLAHPDVRRLD